MGNLKEKKHEIKFLIKGTWYGINVNNIKIIEVFDHKISIVTNHDQLEMRGSLSHYETELLKNNFVKISRSIFVNLMHITNIKGQRIWIDNNKIYTISRERTRSVYKQWMEYRIKL